MNTPALELLMGAYFHQDWMYDHPSSEAAVAAFAVGEHSAVADVVVEITVVLDAVRTEADLEKYLARLGNFRDLGGTPLTYSAWLREIRDQLKGALVGTRPPTAPSAT